MPSRSDLNGHRPVLEITQLSNVVPEDVQWLWPRRIPMGTVTLLGGDPGLGKSYMSTDIAARISTGGPWPDNTGLAPKGNVLLVSAEDDLANTIRPRLDKLKANTKRIRYVGLAVQHGERQEFLSLTDHLDQVVDELQRIPTSLMVIDPLAAFAPGVDSHNDADVRLLMLHLSKAAEDTNCAILCIKHLNKVRGEYNSLYRLGGSIAFSGGARSVMFVAPHPDDPNSSVLAAGKSNLCAKPDSIAYSITDDGFQWGESFVYAADDLLVKSSRPKQPKVDKAKEFLAAYLANGPALSADVIRDAKFADIGESSVEKAKNELGIKSRPGEDGRWYYHPPVTDSK
jgi:hypothetical protein